MLSTDYHIYVKVKSKAEYRAVKAVMITWPHYSYDSNGEEKEFFYLRVDRRGALNGADSESGRGETWPVITYQDFINQYTNSNQNNTMGNVLSSVAKEVLSAKDQKLVEAGYLTNELSISSKGLEAMQAFLFRDYKDELVAMAEEEIKAKTKK